MTAETSGEELGPNLGVIVPCRDEARVIARKLGNLARCRWPASVRAHRVVVVDDGSTDDTVARAQEPLAALRAAGVEACLVHNDLRAGKSGAIEAGLASLAGCVDLIVLSDADVVFELEALARVAQVFGAAPRLGMASGAQRFVAELPASGDVPQAASASTAGLYDRLTAWVRRLESARGRLFSVHGQLLAWRAELGIAPSPGFAADDLDLMAQVRLRDRDVVLVPEARFLEVKTPPGPAREEQASRRARAYVQFLGNPQLEALAAKLRGLDALQVWAYRRLPTSAPWLAPAGFALLILVAILSLQGVALFVALGLFLGALVIGPGRRLSRLVRVIAAATRQERLAPLSDRWETPRA